MKLDVVSEDVLPSERLKRLLRLGNFLGSCEEEMHTGEEIKRGMGRWMATDNGMQQLSSSNTGSKADYNYFSALVTNYFADLYYSYKK